MPRYNFNVHHGVSVPDRTGTVLSGLSEARLAAVQVAGALLEDSSRDIVRSDGWLMEVTDDTGLVLFRLDVSMADAPTLTEGSLRGERGRSASI